MTKGAKVWFILINIVMLLCNAFALYVFASLGYSVKSWPGCIIICEALSPIIFDLHEHSWGIPTFGLWEWCQLTFTSVYAFSLMLFLLKDDLKILRLLLVLIVAASLGHFIYFLIVGPPVPFLVLPGTTYVFPWRWWLLMGGSRLVWMTSAAIALYVSRPNSPTE